MGAKWSADELVPLRTESVDRFKRTFLRQAVCELRFPTLMSLGGVKPPSAFVNAIRKQYPTHELANELTVGVGGASSTDASHAHMFRAAKGNWALTLKASSVTLETGKYPGFVEFRRRVNEMVAAALPVIDSEFFTRVGIRYVNVVPSQGEALEKWINPTLVGAIHGQGFLGVTEYAGKLLLNKEDGGCLLQHGLRHKADPPTPLPKGYVPDYVIDIDVYRNEVSVDDLDDALVAAHTQAFSMFDWALGERARQHLGESDSNH